MATIVLAGVGAAIGGSIGGGLLGLSSVVIGRAIGATVGQLIDQSIMGAGSQVIESGRIDRFRLTTASEGAAVGQVYGRVRIPGQVIWASRFEERSSTSGGGGGKGSPGPQATVTQYSYSVSLAIGLCEGVISRVGRIWADGIEVAKDDLNIRVYHGDEAQMPDPKIEAVQGAGNAAAYRGLAYIVFEDLDLSPFGNRVPQFSFEVMRPDQGHDPSVPADVSRAVQGAALMPGTGEYALSTTPVYVFEEFGRIRATNVNSPGGRTDFDISMEALSGELPNCTAKSLIISWFGDDLRVGSCSIRPKVERALADGIGMPWKVSGLRRDTAEEITAVDGRPVYGGTPTDQSVIESIRALREGGGSVMFYPFILMEQLAGNTLPNPYTGEAGQPVLPWRGRITTSLAPGRDGTPDKTPAAAAEVAAFFGQAQIGDFEPQGDTVDYSGPEEFSYRRFILHYAHLCALAGGVDAFCIGSEMRGLTQIRDGADSFPAVAAMRALAGDVRAILGPDVKIGYASDWSEYFGYHPQDGSGDVFFHLDPLWADEEIDFIGIDNYMPISDWRDGYDHADAAWGAIHDLDYLKANIEGGEGYDWFYNSPEARAFQRRTPIEDGAYGEPWVFRYKDLRNWWENTHFNRPGGVRASNPTEWVPQSKPFWFTEYGCAAIDKGTNQPNKFLDPKSSESAIPHWSNGRRDDLIQAQYIRAYNDYFSDAAKNPVSAIYGGRMVDMGHAYVWAWDARPYPYFPLNLDLWSDGENYTRGHWLNGRASLRTLDSVVREVCAASGLSRPDTSGLFGIVRGYSVAETASGRSVLQPLMLAQGFDALERDGALAFKSRKGAVDATLVSSTFVDEGQAEARLEDTRLPEAELAGRVRLAFVETDGDYAVRTAEAVYPGDAVAAVSQSEFPVVLTAQEGREIAERWLAEARVGRDRVRFGLPLSEVAIGAGDVVRLDRSEDLYRVDTVELGRFSQIEAVRIEKTAYTGAPEADEIDQQRPFVPPVPVTPVFLDLPLLTGEEVPHAPSLAIAASPWRGPVAVYSSTAQNGFELNTLVETESVIGETENELAAALPDTWDRGPALRVRLVNGALSSADPAAVLAGVNAAAIGTGRDDIWEVFQFAEAELVAPDTYDVRLRLRGQAGTGAFIPTAWPVGSVFVGLGGQRTTQIAMPSSARNLSRSYRVGPAERPVDDPVYVQEDRAFAGIGLRPYAPAQLRYVRRESGDVTLRWLRRTRIDGDSWEGTDVPLGEATEAYLVRVRAPGGAILRTANVPMPEWTYLTSMQIEDAAGPAFSVEVAQISDRFGPGAFKRIDING